jgi:hypothetical protein
MNRVSFITVLAAGVLLAGCGERREPRPADETVFKEQVRALDKARSVEEQAEARKRELDRRLEQEAGGD